METDFEFVSLETIDKVLQKKVNIFRRNTSSINGNTRTDEEWAVHNDKFCSDKDIKKWVVALDKGKVIGLGAVFARQIMFLGKSIKLGGVGKIRVAEEYRKMGVASRIMVIVMDELNKVGVDVALLCTNTNSFLVDFYRKYGFQLLGRPYKFKGKSGNPYQVEEGMLAPIRSDQIYVELMQSDQIMDIGIGNW